MGKRKSNGQKRDIAARQKINKTRKAEKLRQVLFRNFWDMTPTPKWKMNDMISHINSIEAANIDRINKEGRRKTSSRDFSSMTPRSNYEIERFNILFAELYEWRDVTCRHNLLTKKF